jgi:membrane fusion protein (multidrug efflux system)
MSGDERTASSTDTVLQTTRTGAPQPQGRAAKFTSFQQQLAAIAANLNGDPDGPVDQNPRYLDAMAQYDEAARQLAHTVVKAAFAGIVINVPSIAAGEYMLASTTAFYLVATDHVWVDANPKETELTYVRPEQPVTVTVDTYLNTEWRGTVESTSPAAAQEFSRLPAQNTSGNWVKVVQPIPMRVRVETNDESLPPLSAGMIVKFAIDTGHARGIPHIFGTATKANLGACSGRDPCAEISVRHQAPLSLTLGGNHNA